IERRPADPGSGCDSRNARHPFQHSVERERGKRQYVPESESTVASIGFDRVALGETKIESEDVARVCAQLVPLYTHKTIDHQAGAAATNSFVPPHERNTPTIPPSTERGKVSVTSWRMIRPRPAPRAVRTATSVLRDAARASNRPATFAHPMIRTNATAPCRIR